MHILFIEILYTLTSLISSLDVNDNMLLLFSLKTKCSFCGGLDKTLSWRSIEPEIESRTSQFCHFQIAYCLYGNFHSNSSNISLQSR